MFKHIVAYVGLSVLLLLFAGTSLYFWHTSSEQEDLLSSTRDELQEARLEIGRGETTIADANKKISTLQKQVAREVKERHATLTMFAELTAKYAAMKKKVKTETRVEYRDRVVTREVNLPPGKIFMKKDGDYKPVKKLTYSYEDHRITIHGDAIAGTLSYELHQRFAAQVVESKLPSGGYNHYINLWELKEDEKLQKLELESFKVTKSDELKPQMYWWNPKLDLMGGALVDSSASVAPHLSFGLSFMGHGKTTDDLSWRFIRVGVGTTGPSSLTLSVSPVQYNVGKYLPLVSNVWATPTFGYDVVTDRWFGGLGISVVF